eukprot:GHVP01043875.1.p1 GENE.GHVP01043875.1~~GHVP01043875.1.p1  ORF type:complete len:598 (+),score=101.67 GHVP01043875.1:67-1860(+)
MEKGEVLQYFCSELPSNDNEPGAKMAILERAAHVAQICGPHATRTQLLPCLESFQTTSPDDLCYILAQQYQNLIPHVGGPEHLHLLVPPLTKFCSNEEAVVREVARKVICQIFKKVSDASKDEQSKIFEQISESPLKKFEEMQQSENFVLKAAACDLARIIYPFLEAPKKRELEKHASKLLVDENSFVKKAAAKLGEPLANECPNEAFVSTLLPSFISIWKDFSQEENRVSSLRAILIFGERLSKVDFEKRILPILLDAVNSRSWRCRQEAANHLSALSFASRDPIIMQHLNTLAQDTQSEVRIAVVEQIEEMVKKQESSTEANEFFPMLVHLKNDISVQVRIATSKILTSLAIKLPGNEVQSNLIPHLTELCLDELPEVRFHALEAVEFVVKTLNPNSPDSPLIMSLLIMKDDNQWRIRRLCAKILVYLTNTMSESNLEELKIAKTIIEIAFQDLVHAVRLSTINLLGDVFKNGPSDWKLKNIVFKLNEAWDLSKAANKHSYSYLTRQSILYGIVSLASTIDKSVMLEHLIPIMESSFADKVPNVRITASKAAHGIFQSRFRDDPEINKRLNVNLSKALRDLDADVSNEAKKVMKN